MVVVVVVVSRIQCPTFEHLETLLLPVQSPREKTNVPAFRNHNRHARPSPVPRVIGDVRANAVDTVRLVMTCVKPVPGTGVLPSVRFRLFQHLKRESIVANESIIANNQKP